MSQRSAGLCTCCTRAFPVHTVAIWTFTFHKISGFVRVILKANFKQTRIMISFIWKLISIKLIFLLFFAGVVKSTAFCTLLLLFQWVDMFELQFDGKMWLKHINLFEICSSNSVQKAVDLTTPAKNRRKMGIINMNFQVKKIIILACRLVWNWPSKSPLQSLIFCEM